MSVKQQLLEVLEDLKEEDLKTFQWHLLDHTFLGGFKEIKRSKLEKADKTATVDVMVETYTDEHVMEVVRRILTSMNLNEVMKKLNLQQTPSPVQQTPPPVQQTPPPVQQTAPPVQQTPPPVQQLTRANLMKYYCVLEIDTNTVNNYLKLFPNKKKVMNVGQKQSYRDHADRFVKERQLLCKTPLRGVCYWEAQYVGKVSIAVSYKGITRGDLRASVFGWNKESWRVHFEGNSYTAWHNDQKKYYVSHSASNKVGVYLDWCAGTLSFYRVSSNTLTHLHTFKTRFTKPVYPGFRVLADSSVWLC